MDEPQTIHPHHKSMHRVRSLKKTLVIVAIFFVIIIAGLCIAASVIMTTISHRSVKNETIKSAATAIASDNTNSRAHTLKVASQLGFSLTYDTSIISGSAQLADTSPTSTHITNESELSQTQAYDIVMLRPKSSKNSSLTSSPELTISTSAKKDFWTSRQQQATYAGKSQIDTLVAYISDSILIDSSISASSTKDITIGAVLYKEVIFSQDNSKYGIKIPTEKNAYFTVQNNRPYWIVLDDSNNNSLDTSMLESVITSIIYSSPVSSSLSLNTSRMVEASSSIVPSANFTLPANTSYVPNTLNPTTLVNVVAKNQPAVVRVLTTYCADITLRSGDKTYTQKDSCTSEIGSGSFISSDGYIATNGHVVTITPQTTLVSALDTLNKVQNLLVYLVQTNAMTPSNALNLINGLQSDDTNAINALDNIGSIIPDNTMFVSNVQSSYTVQIGDNPVRLDKTGTRWKAELNDIVINAKLIDKNYDPITSNSALNGTGNFTTSDVALLKASGSFPTVSLGSIDNLRPGDMLTAIGFPAFIDDAVNTTKWQTVPTVTQGQIISIGPDAPSSNRMLLSTTVPIAEGSSGGPAFNNAGLEIGLNTYKAVNCTNTKCFGNGTIRGIADLKALLNKNNISLTSGPITSDWHMALDDYIAGNYSSAINLFSKVQSEYPANYLASSLDSVARDQLGTTTDTSSSYAARDVIVTILWFVVIIGVLVIINIILLIVHFTRKYHRQRLAYEASNLAS
jgi:hypothetical protein